MNLELTDVEREFLLTLLQERLGELKGEVRHSRVPDFTDQLRAHEACVRGLIGKLETTAGER